MTETPMDENNLGPMTLDEAKASVRELIAKLDAIIQDETEKFMDERTTLLAQPIDSREDQDWQYHRLKQITRAFEDRVYPVRCQRESMLNAIVRVLSLEPAKFYLELTDPRLANPPAVDDQGA